MSYTPTYVLAVSAKYKINVAMIGRHPYDPKTIINKEKFRDAEVTRPSIETDLEMLHTRCLMTVNGYIHPTVWTDNRLFIKEATPSMLKTGMNHVGLLSFYGLGKNIEKLHIKKEMISGSLSSTNEDYQYYNKMIITFDQKVDGNFLVFCGTIITEQEGVLERLDDNKFILYLAGTDFIGRIMNLIEFYDLYEELDLPVSPNNDSGVLVSDLISNETIIKLMERFNTFLCNFPEHKIKYDRLYLKYSNIPNQFRLQDVYITPTNHREAPSWPMLGKAGKLIEYKAKRLTTEETVLYTLDGYLDNLTSSHADMTPEQIATNSRLTYDRFSKANCYLWKIILTKK